MTESWQKFFQTVIFFLNNLLDFIVYLTNYTYEVLISVMQRLRLKTFTELFFAQNKKKIMVSKDMSSLAYVGKPFLGTSLSHDQIKKINTQDYYTGLNRDDYVFISKLEDLYIRKITKDQRDTKKEKEALAKQLKEKKDVEIDENLLGKRGLSLDYKKYQVESNTNNFMFNAPEMRLKYLVEFSKDFVDRTPIDDEEIEPDILKINVNDVNDNITCVESNVMFKVLLIGTYSGKIQAYYLGEDKGEFVAENKEDDEDNLNKFLKAKAKDFSIEIRNCTFIGHQDAVTSMTVNYDSSYFISSSVDNTIR